MKDEVKVEVEKDEKKKTQTTTVAIPRRLLDRLETYCKRSGIMRKDFVELALEYFERTGYELSSSVSDLSQIQSIMQDLQEIKETMKTNNEHISNVGITIEAIKQLPGPEVIQNAADTRAALDSTQKSYEDLKNEHESLKLAARDLEMELKKKDVQIAKMSENLRIAISELKRCSGVFTKPSKSLIESLKEAL